MFYVKNISLTPDNNLTYEVTKGEYEKSENKDNYEIRQDEQGHNYYYKIITNKEEKDTILQYHSYKLLSKISKIATFFLVITVIALFIAFFILIKDMPSITIDLTK